VCRWDADRRRLLADPVGAQGSHHLAAAAGANALVELPPGPDVAAGSDATVVLLSPPRP
jgi:molybdopterin biosynthesis enzyme